MQASTDKDKVILERKGDVGILRLGGDHERILVLTRSRMASLKETLLSVKSGASVKGASVKALVVLGAPEAGFCAGADVHAIRDVAVASEGEQLALEGQEIFSILRLLPIPTISAIHGACVGGGCEFVLNSSWRILLDAEDSKIGLPEIKLGILPGFGGTQLLPRLIGIEKALDIILQGKVIDAVRAKKAGLVDELFDAGTEDKVARFKLLEQFALERAQEFVRLGRVRSRRKLPLKDTFLTHTKIGRSLVQSLSKKAVGRETKGNYPAPLLALSSAIQGLQLPLDIGLRQEARKLGTLIASKESKSLVHLYFLTEASNRLGKTLQDEVRSAHIGIVGGGVMGAGIAAAFVAKGHKVNLVEPIEPVRQRAVERVNEYLSSRKNLSPEKQKAQLAQFGVSEKLDSLSSSHVCIEAIIEDAEKKRELYAALEQILPQDSILCSNTSSIQLGVLDEKLGDKTRFLGMHFFNPVEKMPLVEIIRSGQSSDRSVLVLAALSQRLGKFPVVVKDVPGFLVNRILSPYISEAAWLLQDGCSIEDIDKAATRFGMPMGPLRLLDEVGLDVAAKVQEIMVEGYGARMEAPLYLKKLVEAGYLGKKNGKGFYNHQEKKPVPNPETYTLLGLSAAPKANNLPRADILERLMMRLVNEAVRCLDEGVSGEPGKEAAGQIDLATVMGMGFPPFRGGVMQYAKSLGPVSVLGLLDKYSRTLGTRFDAWEGIRQRARTTRSFD